MKRFYKEVSVSEELGVLLDGRPVKTPAKAEFMLPNSVLAEAVADEWRAQGVTVNPWKMPFTGLANAAIDKITPEFVAGLAAYAESDVLCYRADDPPELVARQEAVWNPMLDWARGRFDVSFTNVAGIMHQPQPRSTVKRLGEALAIYPAFAIAPLSQIITISGSLILALALAERTIEAELAFDAAHLDELWQEEKWGADDFALEARAARRGDFLAACRFLTLLG
jgi:chaperone required for assembly of F1-ATPase